MTVEFPADWASALMAAGRVILALDGEVFALTWADAEKLAGVLVGAAIAAKATRGGCR